MRLRRLALALLLGMVACSKEPTSAEADCPKDLLGAKGKSCSPEGKTCTGGQTQFTHFMMCSRGKWAEMNAPPPPPPPAASGK